MPTALCVQFDDSKKDSLEAIFNEARDSELFWHVTQAFRDFAVKVSVSNGTDTIVLRWDPLSLLVPVDEDEVFLVGPNNEFRLRFCYYVDTAKKNIEYVVEAIKDKIIEICTSCGGYNEVLVQG